MQHHEWQALIPYYLANSLSAEQRRAFEEYLARCGNPCQQEVAEWRTIASAVWEMTDEAARNLPPLSPEVYNRLHYRRSSSAAEQIGNPSRPVYAPPLERRLPAPQRPRWYVPVTLVAGLIVALLLGGLLVRLAFPPESEQDLTARVAGLATDDNVTGVPFGSGLIESTATPTPILPTDTPVVLQPLPTNTLMPTAQPPSTVNSPVFPIPTNAPTLTAQPPVFSPTAMPPTEELPVEPFGSLETFTEPGSGDAAASGLAVGPTQTPFGYQSPLEIQGQPRPLNLAPNTTALRSNGVADCDVWNVDTRPITVYRTTLRGAPIVGQVGQDERIPIQSRSSTGWFEIVLPGAVRGWIAPDDAIVIGNCDMLPQPTPTRTTMPQSQATPTAQTPAGETLRIIQPTALVYELPGQNTIVGQVSQGETYVVTGTTSAAGIPWALITLESGAEGWIRQTDTQPINP